MSSAHMLVAMPWDRVAIGVDVWEIRPGREDIDGALSLARAPGIYSVRVDPRADKKPLHRHGFYYCDTQIMTACTVEQFRYVAHPSVSMELAQDIAPLLVMCGQAFSHSHFHRDFNVDRAAADRRFGNWLQQLHCEGGVYRVTWDGSLAGCFAHSSEGRLALYSTAPAHRGAGRSRQLFGAGCAALFENGAQRLLSPISASNLAIANIHAALGFRAIDAVDIYHRVIA